MGEEKDKYIPPRPDAEDTKHGALKAVISAVPWIGGPAAEVFSMILAPPISRRRDEWMESVADGLRELEDKVEGFSIESLCGDESFVTTLMEASQIAVRNHQQEKLDSLRNAVLNSALPHAPRYDIQAMYLNAVDDFTPLHLRTLGFIAEQSPWYFQENMRAVDHLPPMGLEEHFPELQQHPGLARMIVQDLATYGFVDRMCVRSGIVCSSELPKSDHYGTAASVVPYLGKQFLAFIKEPTVGQG